ncbi:MAG: DNA-processing protein DprA [Acidimicrobiia bacterium]|nr:DNA-processing protein DprA [Acidimicrobiia bacterium]
MNHSAALQLAFGALSPRRIDTLAARHGSIERVVAAVIGNKTDIPSVARDAIAVPAETRESELDVLGISFITANERGFPSGLTKVEGGPRWLFMNGRLREGPSIGIVGSRSCSAYGLELAEAYGFAAARLGWNVVSGLARGIDAAAHRGVIHVGPPDVDQGRCIAVLGCGIDVIYPKENRSLFRKVIDVGGAIVTEFPPGTRPDAWRFPTRNRIIAGLSDVVLVVEASSRGGALITARIALDYGVPVYAVPGDVDRRTSAGTNALIRDGAFPVFGPDDLSMVLELLSPIVEHRVAGGHVVNI